MIAVFGLLLIGTVINISQPILTRIVIDEGLYTGKTKIVVTYSLLILVLHILGVCIGVIKEFLRLKIKNSFNRRIWKKIIDKIYKTKNSVLNSFDQVSFIQRIETDISMICSIFDDGAMLAMTEILSVMGGIIGLFVVSYKMAALVLAFIPIKIFSTYFFSSKNMEIMKNYIAAMQEVSKCLGEYIFGIKDIRLWGVNKEAQRVFECKKNIELVLAAKKSILNYSNINFDSLFIELVVTAIYIIGACLRERELITVGSIVAFITYSTYILAPLSSLFNIGYIIAGIKPSYERLEDFLAAEEEMTGGLEKISEVNSIEFKSLSFEYKNCTVISNICFSVNRNQKIIVMGRNGCGKTTIFNLLLRIENECSGNIYINDKDINMFSVEEIRKHMAVAFTDSYLFNDTIMNNVCLDTSHDEKHLSTILSICMLDRIIEEKGKNFMIGNNGEYLSAGQKKRICIARALLSEREIVILDEPTTNLDVESKNKIIDYIFNMKKTVLIVTHDKDILHRADKIIFIKEGIVNDSGKYEELMYNNSFRNELCEG